MLKLQEIHRTANFSIYCRGEDSYFVSTGDHFLIVPLTATGEVIFTRQASPAFDDDVWMLPYGTCHQPFITNNTVKNKLLCSVGWQAEKLTMLTMLHRYSTSKHLATFTPVFRTPQPQFWRSVSQTWRMGVGPPAPAAAIRRSSLPSSR